MKTPNIRNLRRIARALGSMSMEAQRCDEWAIRADRAARRSDIPEECRLVAAKNRARAQRLRDRVKAAMAKYRRPERVSDRRCGHPVWRENDSSYECMTCGVIKAGFGE